MHLSDAPGPEGHPIPLVHFDDELQTGAKMAVSFAAGRAVFTCARTPVEMLRATPIMLSREDRQALGRMLLADDATATATATANPAALAFATALAIPADDDDDDGLCLCGQPTAGSNTLCCDDCLEAGEYLDMEQDDHADD